jgi:hypothetical protein
VLSVELGSVSMVRLKNCQLRLFLFGFSNLLYSTTDRKRMEAFPLSISARSLPTEIIKLSFMGVKKAVCYCKDCHIDAHNFDMSRHTKFIHALFPGLTCMQIFHLRIGSEIWKTQGRGQKKVITHYKHPLIEEVKMAV